MYVTAWANPRRAKELSAVVPLALSSVFIKGHRHVRRRTSRSIITSTSAVSSEKFFFHFSAWIAGDALFNSRFVSIDGRCD